MQVADIHQSGRFDATKGEQTHMLRPVAHDGTVAAITEARALRPPEGWKKHRGHDETEIVWDTSVWEAISSGVEHIPTPTWHRGGSKRHTVDLTWVLLRHLVTGETLLRGAGHLPAHLDRPAQRAANAAALAGLKAVVDDLDQRLRPTEVTLSFDFNLDLRVKANRAHITRATGLHLVVPPGATHAGGRRIDGWLTTMAVEDTDMLPKATGYDHRGAVAHLRSREPDTKEASMRGFMPEALNKNIRPGANDPDIIPVGVIFHVAVSLSDSLRAYFDGPSGGIESHFYVRLNGTIEQYRSIFAEADAQSAGNSFGNPRRGFVSVETEGMGEGEWTPEQVAALKRIVLFVHGESPFTLRVCPAYNAEGVGYHCLHHEWNPNAHSCPGPSRVQQFHDTFVPWLRDPTSEEDDVSWSEKIDKWEPGDKDRDDTQPASMALNQARGYAKATYRLVHKFLDIDALADAVAERVNAEVNADAETVKQAVKDALAEGVEEG